MLRTTDGSGPVFFTGETREVGQEAHTRARVYQAHRGELGPCLSGGTC